MFWSISLWILTMLSIAVFVYSIIQMHIIEKKMKERHKKYTSDMVRDEIGESYNFADNADVFINEISKQDKK